LKKNDDDAAAVVEAESIAAEVDILLMMRPPWPIPLLWEPVDITDAAVFEEEEKELFVVAEPYRRCRRYFYFYGCGNRDSVGRKLPGKWFGSRKVGVLRRRLVAGAVRVMAKAPAANLQKRRSWLGGETSGRGYIARRH
jgi:hypothetical protein